MTLQTEFDFSGKTYKPERDRARLAAQYKTVFAFMQDGRWHAAQEIERATGYPWASISARLRDMRKDRFGGHIVQRRYVAMGVFEYRLLERASCPQ